MPICPACQREVSPEYRFCPYCGALLAVTVPGPTYPPPSAAPPLPEQPKRSRAKVLAAVVVILLLAFFSVFTVVPVVTQLYYGNTVSGCPRTPGTTTFVSEPNPVYDVQEVMAFTQTYSQLSFNVTAIAQCDADGYGPAYLLNGLSNTGYWYQVGVTWDWPLQSGGYAPGFGFITEAWAPNGLTRAPPSQSFTGKVNSGDTIELSMSFSGGNVVTSARDLATGASGTMSYSADRGTEFIGSQQQQTSTRFSFATRGYFTGLMTEWYHVAPNVGSPGGVVTYSEDTSQIASATLGVGEWNFTTSSPSSVFSLVANNGNPVDFAATPSALQQFTLNGLVVSADAFEFVT